MVLAIRQSAHLRKCESMVLFCLSVGIYLFLSSHDIENGMEQPLRIEHLMVPGVISTLYTLALVI